MEFDDYMTAAVQKAGSQKKLADALHISESNMSQMIKGKRPIPAEGLRVIALTLADGTTPGQLWEAQQAARAATEEERQLWLPFVKGAHGMAHAASILFALVVTLFLTAPEKAQATSMSYDTQISSVKIIGTRQEGWARLSGQRRQS